MRSTDWWRTAAVYQVYIRSFADGNGDGVGDIEGLRSRLPYLVELGIDALWINPWYPSPMVDGGYDVADYRAIHPDLGTLASAQAMLDEAHAAGLKVIVDLVPNHCSSEHEWFKAALAGRPGSPERDRFHFVGSDGAPPSDWSSAFGGPAWTQVEDGQWYLHLFDRSQPDLNWANPDVRTEFVEILRFWLDRGVDGFRVDVAHGLTKDTSWPDVGGEESILSSVKQANHPHWDRDEVHPIIREWRAVLDEYDDRMMVAEAWVSVPSLAKYLRPDEYHQSFSFELLGARWCAEDYRRVITSVFETASSLSSSGTWVLSNHDVMRPVTRLGLPEGVDWRTWPVGSSSGLLDAEVGQKRARAVALVLLGLPGSAYIYQGDELGLPEVWDLPWDALDDPIAKRSRSTRKGRDGCRVPLPWSVDRPSFGFGSADSWLPQPTWFAQYAVDEQIDDEVSTYSLYHHALRIRREQLVADTELTWLEFGSDVLAYGRGSGLWCIANMGIVPIELPNRSVLVASEPGVDGTLEPNAAVWMA